MSADAHLTAGVTTAPKKVGLYDPANEKDACGIGFIADLTRTPTRSTVVVRAPLLPPLPREDFFCELLLPTIITGNLGNCLLEFVLLIWVRGWSIFK